MFSCLQLYKFNATFVGMYVVNNQTKFRYRKAAYSLFIEIYTKLSQHSLGHHFILQYKRKA